MSAPNTAHLNPLDSLPGPPMSINNVIVFGETGVGKSSVVNMLLGERRAQTSMSAKGCTFASVPYDVVLGGDIFVRIHDTAGLDESSAGTVSPENAVANLYDLLRKLEDGISLLVYVTRLGRITERNQKNYNLFFEGICQKRVPIVLVVTHGEDACGDEDDDDDYDEAMDQWWVKNQPHFMRSGMAFNDQAIIIAIKKGFRKEYEESSQRVRTLIQFSLLSTPWKMDGLEWARVSIKYVLSLFGWALRSHWRTLIRTLSTGRMTQNDATRLVSELITAENPPLPVISTTASRRRAPTSDATLPSPTSAAPTNEPPPVGSLILPVQPNEDPSSPANSGAASTPGASLSVSLTSTGNLDTANPSVLPNKANQESLQINSAVASNKPKTGATPSSTPPPTPVAVVLNPGN